mgnify:CR=1 FL=1
MDFTNASLTFDGPRITVRTMETSDATERYASWLNDPEINRYLGTKSATIEELRDYISNWNQQSNALFFGIFIKDGAHIGTIKLEPIDIENKTAMIAIMIGDKSTWGKGYGSEAMKLLIDWCFEELKLEKITLGVVSTHMSAIQAYEKLGFEGYEVEPQCLHYGDEVHDRLYMALKRPV